MQWWYTVTSEHCPCRATCLLSERKAGKTTSCAGAEEGKLEPNTHFLIRTHTPAPAACGPINQSTKIPGMSWTSKTNIGSTWNCARLCKPQKPITQTFPPFFKKSHQSSTHTPLTTEGMNKYSSHKHISRMINTHISSWFAVWSRWAPSLLACSPWSSCSLRCLCNEYSRPRRSQIP